MTGDDIPSGNRPTNMVCGGPQSAGWRWSTGQTSFLDGMVSTPLTVKYFYLGTGQIELSKAGGVKSHSLNIAHTASEWSVLTFCTVPVLDY